MGVEPTTYTMRTYRSSQLSYCPKSCRLHYYTPFLRKSKRNSGFFPQISYKKATAVTAPSKLFLRLFSSQKVEIRVFSMDSQSVLSVDSEENPIFGFGDFGPSRQKPFENAQEKNRQVHWAKRRKRFVRSKRKRSGGQQKDSGASSKSQEVSSDKREKVRCVRKRSGASGRNQGRFVRQKGKGPGGSKRPEASAKGPVRLAKVRSVSSGKRSWSVRKGPGGGGGRPFFLIFHGKDLHLPFPLLYCLEKKQQERRASS